MKSNVQDKFDSQPPKGWGPCKHLYCSLCYRLFWKRVRFFKNAPRDYHFCSYACHRTWRRGVNHHRWLGGKTAAVKRFNKTHPEWYRHSRQCVKARQRGAAGTHTLAEWEAMKAEYNYNCAHCFQRKPLTKDHIRPIIHGGTNDITNIQPLCHTCNCTKNARPDINLCTYLFYLICA